MSCSPFDLRDYFFGELPEEGRHQVELHSRSCVQCREELNRLLSTQAALLAVADEEIPQRIGFVSDRVYEPSRLRRWWRAFWGSAPRLGFASAAMLSAAIIFSASHRPAPAPMDVARLQTDFSQKMNEAVERAVAESDARYEERTARLLAATGRQFEAAMMEKYARRDYRAAILRNVSQ
jgi:anti-sigma factor RsiW